MILPLYFQPPTTTSSSKNIKILTKSPEGMWVDLVPTNHDLVCSDTLSIITTNKNNTATAPTYTINSIIPKNSAPIIIKRHPTDIKSSIKKKTELMVLLDEITIRAENIAIIEKK
tara:strand:+ start:88 stop:432 length:345 start_codon:yes stop_codon:yes gene_type:complete